MKPLRIWDCVTVAVDRKVEITLEQATVDALDVRPFHKNDPVLFDEKRFSITPSYTLYYFYRDEGLTWVRGWDAAARDALEAAVRLRQSA